MTQNNESCNMWDPDTGGRRRLGKGEGLEALEPLDINKCNTISELVQGMSLTAFGGRRLGEAADVLEQMIRDQDCFRVLTLTGAMTIAKQTLIICELIERGWVQAIVSTGALIGHGLVEGEGMKHFKVPESFDDVHLEREGYNRVYDTIEPEYNLVKLEDTINAFLRELAKKEPAPMVLSSFDFCHRLGEYLAQNGSKGRGILKSAYFHNVPVYIPAFTDCELALDLLLTNLKNVQNKGDRIDNIDAVHDFTFHINPMLDLWDFTRRILKAKIRGILTIGGGVPRNWAQQMGPMTEIITHRLNWKFGRKQYSYGVRICPEPEHWGGLSGCSYSEGKSWGKFEPEAKTAEVIADATIVLPIIVRAVMERLAKS